MKKYTDSQLQLLTGTSGLFSCPVSFDTSDDYITFLGDYFFNNDALIRNYLCTCDEHGNIPNSLDISISPHVPNEVKDMFNLLNQEHPLIRGASSSEEAMELIKPRFAQYGSELYPYIEHMIDILREQPEQPEQPEQSEQSEQSEQPET